MTPRRQRAGPAARCNLLESFIPQLGLPNLSMQAVDGGCTRARLLVRRAAERAEGAFFFFLSGNNLGFCRGKI